MGRPRNPQRDLSLERYVENDGKISTAELAKLAGVPESRIRKWKSEDKWDEALKKKPRKRGGQKGNKNAAGKTPAKKAIKMRSHTGHLHKPDLRTFPRKRQRKSRT